LADAATLTIDLGARIDPQDAPVPRHRASTWLIDFSEKAFAPVWEALKRVKPAADPLTAFAADFIARKSMRRGFDLASQVARSREGDCTEHAVFLAALLRHAKLPARVMLGLVVVVFEGRPQAFGHAWTEVWQGGRWSIADAAISRELEPQYLPTEEVVDEGPGFTVALVPGVQALKLEGLRLVPR
jgi:transglutaminase-like putative cysteine protease